MDPEFKSYIQTLPNSEAILKKKYKMSQKNAIKIIDQMGASWFKKVINDADELITTEIAVGQTFVHFLDVLLLKKLKTLAVHVLLMIKFGIWCHETYEDDEEDYLLKPITTMDEWRNTYMEDVLCTIWVNFDFVENVDKQTKKKWVSKYVKLLGKELDSFLSDDMDMI